METTGELRAQPHGGRLRNGGTNRGGTGRPPNVLREGFRKKLPTELRKLQAEVRKMDKLLAESSNVYHLERLVKVRLQLVEFLAKYGLGTTITETNAEGGDVQRFSFLIDSPSGDSDN